MHVPVLLEEVVRLLAPERGGVFADCTLGLGGHAQALLRAGATRLIGIDRDAAALRHARDVLEPWAAQVTLVHGNYDQLTRVLREEGVHTLAGVLADLGVSSMQLDSEGRGFSFQRDEPLDMRMDQSSGPTAADLLATVPEADLADIIFRFGEEHRSRRVARALVRARDSEPLLTTGQLAAVVRRAAGPRGRQHIDPATRTFQALRIWVNGELNGLETFVGAAIDHLAPSGGRCAVISFHSLEDRIVKHAFRRAAGCATAAPDTPWLQRTMPAATTPAVRLLTRRPVTAAADEVVANPRSRSAKLRAVERL